jgi:hypothetical protein
VLNHLETYSCRVKEELKIVLSFESICSHLSEASSDLPVLDTGQLGVVTYVDDLIWSRQRDRRTLRKERDFHCRLL